MSHVENDLLEIVWELEVDIDIIPTKETTTKYNYMTPNLITYPNILCTETK